VTQLRTDVPHVLYKLRGVDHFRRDVRDLLENRQVYLAQPSSLNDPYELLPFVRVPPLSRQERWIQEEVRNRPAGVSEREVYRWCMLLCTSPRHRQRFVEGMLDEHGVLCLSRPLKSSVLWAHYASCHRGFAVGYRARNEAANETLPAFPVLYRKRRVGMYAFGGPEPDWFRILTTKARDWSYEGEWRYVRLKDDGGPGLMDVPTGAIIEVLLGLATSRWHADRVIAAARRLQDQPRIFRAVRHPTEFGLSFEEVS
jgi:hypothetical protein